MHLPTTISNTAVKKSFMEFGEVHTVFAGWLKDEFKVICNGKRDVCLTPFKSQHGLSHKIKYGEDDRFFYVIWVEKFFFCKWDLF